MIEKYNGDYENEYNILSALYPINSPIDSEVQYYRLDTIEKYYMTLKQTYKIKNVIDVNNKNTVSITNMDYRAKSITFHPENYNKDYNNFVNKVNNYALSATN